MRQVFNKNWLLAGFALVLAACAGNPATSLPPINSPALTEYKLASGDQIRVVIFGHEDVPTEYTLDEKGEISIPLAARVVASGLTARELEARLAKQLENVLVDPQVSVELQTARPVFVLGGVNGPGPYPYARNMTVLSAIATAEGFTEGAFDDVFKLTRKLGDGSTKEWRAGPETFVYPDDVIFVYEKF